MINYKEDKILILSPHVDDEVLGCGGLILKCKPENIYIYEFTVGNKTRREELESFKRLTGIKNITVVFDDDKHLRLDMIEKFKLINIIESTINEIKPNIVLIPYSSYNQDHEVINEVACAALRSKRKGVFYPDIIAVYEYPQVNWNFNNNKFTPNMYIDISDVIDKKVQLMSLFKSQVSDKSYAISVEGMKAMASYRGFEATMEYAEAYDIKKVIQR